MKGFLSEVKEFSFLVQTIQTQKLYQADLGRLYFFPPFKSQTVHNVRCTYLIFVFLSALLQFEAQNHCTQKQHISAPYFKKNTFFECTIRCRIKKNILTLSAFLTTTKLSILKPHNDKMFVLTRDLNITLMLYWCHGT